MFFATVYQCKIDIAPIFSAFLKVHARTITFDSAQSHFQTTKFSFLAFLSSSSHLKTQLRRKFVEFHAFNARVVLNCADDWIGS